MACWTMVMALLLPVDGCAASAVKTHRDVGEAMARKLDFPITAGHNAGDANAMLVPPRKLKIKLLHIINLICVNSKR